MIIFRIVREDGRRLSRYFAPPEPARSTIELRRTLIAMCVTQTGSDAPLGPFINVQLKDVRPGVMADHIQVVLPTNDLGDIDLGNKNSFAIRVRSGDEISERVDNAASAGSDHRFWIIAETRSVVGGKIATTVELIGGKNEAAALDSNVSNCGEPGVP